METILYDQCNDASKDNYSVSELLKKGYALSVFTLSRMCSVGFSRMVKAHSGIQQGQAGRHVKDVAQAMIALHSQIITAAAFHRGGAGSDSSNLLLPMWVSVSFPEVAPWYSRGAL